MPDRLLENYGMISGDYNGILFEDSRSTVSPVRLAEVPFTKEADQSIWFSGELTFTLTVDNTAGEGPLTDVVITDLLDITMFALIESSIVVEIDGVPLVPVTDYTVVYNAVSGLLTITIINDNSIDVGSIATVTFRGTKVP